MGWLDSVKETDVTKLQEYVRQRGYVVDKGRDTVRKMSLALKEMIDSER